MEVSGKKASEIPSTSILPGSDDDAQFFCIPCEQEGHCVQPHGYCQNCAEYLCETCYRSHRKPAPCRNHILLDSSKMPKSQKYQRSHPVAHDLVEPCPKHPGEIIKYYCRDHAFLGCSPCITINHRACKVDYIPDVSENFVASQEYTNLLHSLKTLCNSCKEITVTTKENKREIKKRTKDLKEKIVKFRQDINHTLDKWETELNQQVEQIFGKESTKAESVETECNEASTEVQKLQHDIETLHKSSKLNELFIKVKKNENNLKKYEELIDQMQEKNTVSDVTFQSNLAIDKMLLRETSLGQLIPQQDGSRKCLSTTETEQSYKHHKEPAMERKQQNLDREEESQNTSTQRASDKETETEQSHKHHKEPAMERKQQNLDREEESQNTSTQRASDKETETEQSHKHHKEPAMERKQQNLDREEGSQNTSTQRASDKETETEQSHKHHKEPAMERKQQNLDRQAGGQNTNTKKVSDKESVSQKQQTTMTEVKGQKNRGADVYDNISATQSSKIKIQTEKDSCKCKITGMAIISRDKLAIADNGNSSIKIVDTKQSRILSDVKMNSSPWDVVTLPADELAITIPWNSMIQVLSISDQLSIIRQIKVKGLCHGLSYFNQNFVVTFKFPTKVEILTVQGDLLMTLMNDQSFQTVQHIATDDSKNLIYVSVFHDSSYRIACLSLNGEITGIYEDSKLISPCGLAVLGDGSLLVASSVRSKICLVSSDFKTSRVLQNTDGLYMPESVALDREQKKLYVGSYIDSCISVYELKW